MTLTSDYRGEIMRVLSITLLLFSTSVFAELASIGVSGTFSNEQGCRAYLMECYHFELEGTHNRCSMELTKNGKELAHLGKVGKIVATPAGLIQAEDIGFRTTITGIPEFKYVKAEISILSTYKDPSSYIENFVSEFDIEVQNGAFGKKVKCNNMKLEAYED